METNTAGDDATRFGFAEFAYILNQYGNASSGILAEAVGKSAILVDEDILAAGVSSLLARGLLKPAGNELEAADAVSVVTYMTLNCLRAVQLGLVDAEAEATAYVIGQAPLATLIFEPSQAGVWAVSAVSEGSPLHDIVMRILDIYSDARPGITAYLTSSDASGAATLMAVRDPADRDMWRAARGDAPQWTAAEDLRLSDSELIGLLAALFGETHGEAR